MKSTIQVLVVIFSVVLSVSFIGFNRTLNESEMKQVNNKAQLWLEQQLNKHEYGDFLKARPSIEGVEFSSITKKINQLIKNVDCSSLNKVITIGEDEPEAVQDFKIGVKNCANVVSDHMNQNPENLLIDFKTMVKDYKEALKDMDYPNDEVLRQDFELIFYRYAHLIRKTENTVLAPITYFVLGDSAMRANNENLFMVGPVLLAKVVFKKNEGSVISRFAWVRLQENIHFGYTGSAGDNTPKSWGLLLKDMSYIVTNNS